MSLTIRLTKDFESHFPTMLICSVRIGRSAVVSSRLTVGQATDAFLRGTLSPPALEGRDPSPKTGPDTPRPHLASPIGAAYQQ